MKVYWHSRKKMWSIVEGGLVTKHAHFVDIQNCTFKVNEKGRLRVIAEGKKNVHAYVIGDAAPTSSISDRLNWTQVRYNPYSMDQFIRMDTNKPVYIAPYVYMDINGQVFADLT